MGKTLGFYQKFPLDLQRLSSALLCLEKEAGNSQASLAECMGVNQPVTEGYIGWLRHVGLLEKGMITEFGRLASKADPMLRDIGTQWVLHYYLVTEHNERSDAWHVLFNDFLSQGATFTSEEFQTYFSNMMGPQAKNRSALSNDPQNALSTYLRPQALGKLGILMKQGRTYTVNTPVLPHIQIIGYVLLEWWQRHYNQTNTLRFSHLYQEKDSLGRVFLADDRQVRQFVRELTGLGYVSFSETQHEPVNRLFNEPPIGLLEQYYRLQ